VGTLTLAFLSELPSQPHLQTSTIIESKEQKYLRELIREEEREEIESAEENEIPDDERPR
jgi:hypothetical protein